MVFAKGQKPWNFGIGLITDCTCQFCGRHFQLPEPQVKRGRGKYCNRDCFFKDLTKFSARGKILALYKQGKTYKEIGDALGVMPATVAGQVYRMKLADRFGDGINSRRSMATIKNILKENYLINECELCGYSRVIEMAHVIERKNGGEYLVNNCLLLCPNCHHLFDYNMLTDNERHELLNILRLNGNLERRLG